MVEYIYFVKCPNCEDEHFDFFDEAKAYALNCLGDKPVITQVEVCRNDFGECTDSTDLGVKWSWEDMVADTTETPEVSVFSKGDLVPYDPDRDPEFATLDNSLDNVPDNFRKPIAEDFTSYYDYDHMNDHMTKEELYSQLVDQGNVVEIAIGDQGAIETQFSDGGVYSDSILRIDFENGIFDVVMWHYSADGDATDDVEYSFSTESFDELWEELLCFEPEALTECSRKPIPEGMTIEQLVEEMEENEDTVECALCNELFPKTDCTYDKEEGYICPQCEEKTEKCSFCGFRYDPSELRFEVGNGGPDEGLGWLCSRCEAAIKSRGETLTFRENNYWDFLDEDADPEETSDAKDLVESLTWICMFDGKEVGTVSASTEDEALAKMQLEYPEYNYGEYDGCFEVFPDVNAF